MFVPTGSPAYDFYGANRPGDNLFANALIALKADTGERVWHFQTVRHDIWDRDLPAQPTLVTVTREGRRVDAVAQTTKSGLRVPVRAGERPAPLPHRIPEGPGLGRRGRGDGGDAAVPAQPRSPSRASSSPRTCSPRGRRKRTRPCSRASRRSGPAASSCRGAARGR